jgi:hypothetical protein
MRPWARSLLGSLVAATIACIASGPRDSAAAAPTRGGAKQDTYIVLVGASGHDSVGSLLPLPLMLSPRFRATKPWRGKLRPCCAATRASSKNQQ